VKTKQFLSSVPFISYRRVLTLIRALRPIDVYLGDISKRRHSIRSLFKVPAFCWSMHQTHKPIGLCDIEREKTYRSTLSNAIANNAS